MKLIGVRFSRYNLTFSRSFLYVLILNHLFKNVKKFANFLDNFLKRKGERRMVESFLIGFVFGSFLCYIVATLIGAVLDFKLQKWQQQSDKSNPTCKN